MGGLLPGRAVLDPFQGPDQGTGVLVRVRGPAGFLRLVQGPLRVIDPDPGRVVPAAPTVVRVRERIRRLDHRDAVRAGLLLIAELCEGEEENDVLLAPLRFTLNRDGRDAAVVPAVDGDGLDRLPPGEPPRGDAEVGR